MISIMLLFRETEVERQVIVVRPAASRPQRRTNRVAPRCRHNARRKQSRWQRLGAVGCRLFFAVRRCPCSLFLAVILPPLPVKKRGFLRPRPAPLAEFCRIYSDICGARGSRPNVGYVKL